MTNNLDEVMKTKKEVSLEIARLWLGVTLKHLMAYLKSKQIAGVKVGDEWFIKTESLLQIRPTGIRLNAVILPEIENPQSKSQYERQKNRSSWAEGSQKEWSFYKTKGRSPLKLNGFLRYKEVYSLLFDLKNEIESVDYTFFDQELLLIGDDLGAGFYSYGIMKRKLYGRARIRAGRIVARALILSVPQGFMVGLYQLVEAITFLCRKMEPREVLSDKAPQKA